MTRKYMKPQTKERPILRRPCERCSNMYQPLTKFSRICEACKSKTWRDIRIKKRQRIQFENKRRTIKK